METSCQSCPKCGQKSEEHPYFCARCGAFIRHPGATVPVFRRHFWPASGSIGLVGTKMAEMLTFTPEAVSVPSGRTVDFCDPMDGPAWDEP